MPLWWAEVWAGLFLLAIALFFGRAQGTHGLRRGLRSRWWDGVLFSAAAGWFCWRVIHLQEADFGDHKGAILVGAVALWLASFRFIPDFLGVRGAALLLLLSASPLLEAAYMEPYQSRLFLVTGVYFFILLGLYWAVAPYRMRDFLEWLGARKRRMRTLAALSGLYGVLLLGCAWVAKTGCS